jgi:nucleoside-diphosphate-sugar epimerase
VRALVTGAAGFIGSHLCRRLVADGHQVVGLDDLSEGSRENVERTAAVNLLVEDLRDEEAVLRGTEGCDVIFHQGAKRSVPRSMKEPALFTDVNVRGTLNVLLAAREHGARVVVASSSSCYGDQDRFPLVETLPAKPRSPYAASKLAGEAYCSAFWLTMGVRAIALRYFNVYGPWQDPASEYAAVIPRFVLACLTGQRPVIYGDGEQARDFTYIDDVVEANLLASVAGDGAQGEMFNVGGGAKPTSVNEVLRTVSELTDTQPDPIREPPRDGDVRLTEADISKTRKLLGYEPKVGVREGLERTVEHFRRSLVG